MQVRSLLQDIEKAEGRLEASKMKEKVLFHCTTKRYLRALKAEWEKAEKAKSDAKKAAGKSKKKAGAAHRSCHSGHVMVLLAQVYTEFQILCIGIHLVTVMHGQCRRLNRSIRHEGDHSVGCAARE